MPVLHLTRRRALQTGLVTTAAAGLAATAPAPALASPPGRPGSGELVDLGIAMESVNVRLTGSGPDGAGGTSLYALSDGTPVTFSVISPETGKRLFSWSLPDESLAYGAGVYGIEGGAYFTARSGSATALHFYDHAEQSVTHITTSGSGQPIANAVIRNVIPDGDTLYFCCYPRSEVYALDLSSGEVREFGPASDNGGEYAWGFTKIGGALYVGTGIGTGQLVAIDTETGQRTEIELDDPPASIAALGTAGPLLLVPLPGRTGVYDTTSGTWHENLPGMDQVASAFASGGDPALSYFRVEEEFWAFDADSLEATPLGFAEHGVSTSSLRALEAFPVDDHDVIACFRQDGEVIVFDPSADEVSVHDVAVDSAPVIAHSIGLGPDRNVWVGAYLSAGVIATVDSHSREITQLEGPEQGDAIAAVGPYLMVSKYPNGVVYRYDAREPWEWDSNPDTLATLISPHLQDRIFEMTDAGGLLAAASIPEYGHLGGALSLIDPDTGEYDVYRDVVADQGVSTVVHRDGIIYAGTTIYGGMSTVPTTTDGHLVEFDLDSREVTSTIVPVPGDETVSTLCFEPEASTLVGVTYESNLFTYDITTHEVTSVIELGITPTGATWGRSPTLRYRKHDRSFYGVGGQTFFRVSATGEVTVLDEEHAWKSLTITARGEIYLIDDNRVHIYDVG
ncbi:hypothetical protein [Brachybacterium sp. FME24]|uniref:hypothetical protein n=1 Tax=Brachybacterium sp. FME24 TaxID=2742605 RepID=UPI0018695888|nr:hypothetical protein [Brachybacterium sp. FME24]